MPRILVIDDDAPLRQMIVRMLVRAGHTVDSASGGAAGLEQWRTAGADLVLTDLQMPGVNGIEVIVQLRAFAPTLPVVAMSGGDRSGDLDLLGNARLLNVGLLQKPFGRDELLAAVRAALEPPSDTRVRAR